MAVDRGLYFYGARWYDASLARFIQADTIVPQPGNPQALNRYAYTLNNPIRYTDPSGRYYVEDRPKSETGREWLLPAGNPFTGVPTMISAAAVEEADGPATTAEVLTVLSMPYVSAVAGVVGTAALAEGGWALALRLMGPACADGDCGNEVNSIAKTIEGRFALIKTLPDEIAATFENGQYQGRILQRSLEVYRAEGTTFGRWFGTIKPDSAANAERLYNVVKYGNNVLEVSKYRVYAGTTIYEGPVANGTGWQIFIEEPLGGFVQLLTTQPLPQWGF